MLSAELGHDGVGGFSAAARGRFDSWVSVLPAGWGQVDLSQAQPAEAPRLGGRGARPYSAVRSLLRAAGLPGGVSRRDDLVSDAIDGDDLALVAFDVQAATFH